MSVPLRRVASRSVVVAVLAVGLWLGAADRVRADPLNPLDFPSLGAFPTAPGGYTINTSGTPTLTVPGGTLTGVVFHGIAVFDFDAINVTGQQGFFGTGSLPLALLSRTNATIAGTIDGSGQGLSSSGPGGPGGGNGPVFPFTNGGGPGGGGPGVGATMIFGASTGGGGGGFGGPGGAGASSGSNLPAGLGGAPYGDLARQLQGGSGGGTSFGPGAGGGGAIEIGAVGSLAISGSILARGGSPISATSIGGGGGGSGGGILLHADSVRLTGSLSAVGGDGGSASSIPGPGGSRIDAGGGGGGGRVTILSGPGGFVESGATIDVAGGAGGVGGSISADGGAGGTGVIVITAVPEPASLVLLGTGVLGLLGLGWMRRRAAPA